MMPLHVRLMAFDEVESTNTVVKHAIEAGEPEGLVVRARVQTGGYGRQGRTWESPEGGLYQSLLLRPVAPSAELPTLALAAALAVRAALLRTGGLPEESILVKWPNDIVCAAGKLVGISCELHAGAVCLGVGVNVMRPAARSAQHLAGKNAPAYLADLMRRETSDAESLISRVGDAVLDSIATYYDRWQQEGFSIFADEFAACSSLSGKRVRIADVGGNAMLEGTVSGVDASGRLLVRTVAGETPVTSGEAHII